MSIYAAAPGYLHLDIPQVTQTLKAKAELFTFTHLQTCSSYYPSLTSVCLHTPLSHTHVHPGNYQAWKRAQARSCSA